MSGTYFGPESAANRKACGNGDSAFAKDHFIFSLFPVAHTHTHYHLPNHTHGDEEAWSCITREKKYRSHLDTHARERHDLSLFPPPPPPPLFLSGTEQASNTNSPHEIYSSKCVGSETSLQGNSNICWATSVFRRQANKFLSHHSSSQFTVCQVENSLTILQTCLSVRWRFIDRLLILVGLKSTRETTVSLPKDRDTFYLIILLPSRRKCYENLIESEVFFSI